MGPQAAPYLVSMGPQAAPYPAPAAPALRGLKQHQSGVAGVGLDGAASGPKPRAGCAGFAWSQATPVVGRPRVHAPASRRFTDIRRNAEALRREGRNAPWGAF